MVAGRKDLDLEIALANSPFTTKTLGIVVAVVPVLSPEESQIDRGIFVYRYTIRIRNDSSETVQLLTRHWVIQDSLGNTEEVRGEGVVGNKPILGPGQEFTYTSFCPLKTPTGSMSGSYEMKKADGTHFQARIGEFFLKDPTVIN
jgi:ApaG protein